MIDFTTLQANPIPLPVVELQKAYNSLSNENKAIKTISYIGLGALAAYLIYRMYKKRKADESNKNQ